MRSPAGTPPAAARPVAPDRHWPDPPTAVGDDADTVWLPSGTAWPELPTDAFDSHAAYWSGGVTGRTGTGARQRWSRIALLFAALGLLVLATAVAAGGLRPAPVSVPVPILAPAPPRPAPPGPPLPVTVPGLLAAVTRDPAAAGVDGPLLRDDLTAVASSTGEARRQNAMRVLTLAATGHLVPEYARAATTATTPYTVLDAPVDLIADLAPDPAAGGPNAHFLLNCMLDLQGRSPATQRDEANEVLARIPVWARNGGIKPDLVAAAVRIVTPVAQGTATFTDAQTGFDPKRPRPSDGS